MFFEYGTLIRNELFELPNVFSKILGHMEPIHYIAAFVIGALLYFFWKR
jgi:hypothetical protein